MPLHNITLHFFLTVKQQQQNPPPSISSSAFVFSGADSPSSSGRLVLFAELCWPVAWIGGYRVPDAHWENVSGYFVRELAADWVLLAESIMTDRFIRPSEY